MINFNEYPYRNLTDLNLDYLEKKMNVLKEIMDTFVSLNTVTFADPIIWNITTQYSRNTVVLDTTGNAYLSKVAVPTGVQLNNSDFWLEIFNFTEYTRTANQNLTVNVETNTTRATHAYIVDDWLIWDDVLYKVTSPIAIDDALIVAPTAGANITHFTVEDFIKAFMTWATNTIQQYKNDIDASELLYRQQLAGDIANTTASLQAQLNAAIAGVTVDSEVINARIGYDGVTYNTLGDAIRTQILRLYKYCDFLADEHGPFNSRYAKMKIDLDVGGVNTTNPTNATSTNRARTEGTIPYNQDYIFKFPYGVKHRFICSRQTRDESYNINTEVWEYLPWSDALYDTLPDLAWPVGEIKYRGELRLLVGYNDDRTIDNTNIPEIEIIAKIKDEDGSITKASENGYYENAPSWQNIGTRKCFHYDDGYNACNFIPIKAGDTYAFNVIRAFFVSNNLHGATAYSNMPALRYFTASANETVLFMGWRKSDCDKNFYDINEVVCGNGIDKLIPILLKGKRLSVLGDSISAYTGHTAGYDPYYTGNNSGVSRYTQMWWQVLCDNTGMIPLVINAETGSAITQLEDSAHVNKIPMSSDVRCSGLSDNGINPDVIIIAGGVNDYSYSMSEQSEPLEWDGLTAPIISNSFTEAYACMIKKLQTNYPNAIIVALTTWFTMRGTDNGYTLTHQSGNRRYTQEDYNEAITKVCKQMRIPVIDVTNIGFNRNNFYPTYAVDSSVIPTHPNAAGQRIMGLAIAKKLGELVKAFLTDL